MGKIESIEHLNDHLSFLSFLVEKAKSIPHEDKKTFCQDTRQVFHAEFARLIGLPINLLDPYLNYYLFAMDEWNSGSYAVPLIDFTHLENAKAQFKCTQCHHLWTSMRARIAFYVTQPGPYGFIFLEIMTQNCKLCMGVAEALWYMGKQTINNG